MLAWRGDENVRADRVVDLCEVIGLNGGLQAKGMMHAARAQRRFPLLGLVNMEAR